jgi:hypothetical protein
MSSFVKQYGLDWPKDIHPVQIDLCCSKKWREPEYQAGNLLDPGEHMLRAIRVLFTHDEWSLSPWTEEHAHAWCLEEVLGIIGCASSSKSNDVGGFCVLDWVTDPTSTITIMASTSKLALADRSYESVLRYFKLLKSKREIYVPGKEAKTVMAIINESDDEYGQQSTDKAAIRGVAVQAGTADEARANLQGRHMPYVRLICDEFAQMRKAAADARTNLRIGAMNFKWVFMANPDSIYDMSGKFSEPIDGWASVDEATPRWRSKYGLILHRNGYQSPAVIEPDGPKKYPYLINSEHIAAVVRENHGNPDASDIWTMVKGFPPPQGDEETVLTEADVIAFDMKVMPIWDLRGTEKILVAGLDPAFTTGGDACVLQPGEIGLVREGTVVLNYGEPVYIPIEASSKRPVAYQVSDKCLMALQELGIPVSHMAIDDSGTQSVADIIQIESGQVPIRCNFSSSASDMPLSRNNLIPAKERFRDLGTEIWMLVAEYGRFRQLRGFGDKAAQQFCLRRFRPRTAAGGAKRALESKKDYKKRLPGQRSPDEGDGVALCAFAARAVGGLRAGFDQLNDLDILPRSYNVGNMKVVSQNFLRPNYTKGVDKNRYSGYLTN